MTKQQRQAEKIMACAEALGVTLRMQGNWVVATPPDKVTADLLGAMTLCPNEIATLVRAKQASETPAPQPAASEPCQHPRKWVMPLIGDWFWCSQCGALTGVGKPEWTVPPFKQGLNPNCPRPDEPFVPPASSVV